MRKNENGLRTLMLCAATLTMTGAAACMQDSAVDQGGPTFGPGDVQSASPVVTQGDTAGPPSFGKTVSQPKPPPPISGGTLALAKDGNTIAAADPDRDRVYVVDLAARALRTTVQLLDGDEPGRVAFDASGRVHVALRRGNALVTIDPATGSTTRRAACVSPRGVAYDARNDTVVLACADGNLLRFPAAGGAFVSDVFVRRDLRDVVVKSDGSTLVSTFKTAHVLHLDARGVQIGDNELSASEVAWRMIPALDGTPEERVFTMAQEPQPATVSTGVGGYSNSTAPCSTEIVTSHVELVGLTSQPLFARMPQVVLPVDIATDGETMAIVSAASAHREGAPQLYTMAARSVTAPNDPSGNNCAAAVAGTTPGEPTAVVFDGAGELVVQSREPAALYIMSPNRTTVWKTIPLASDSREDTGHAIFHSDSGKGISCASCHAEGGDDGYVWTFDLGARRTPALHGTVAHTQPYHWDGSQADMSAIVKHVFEGRMSGPVLAQSETDALQKYLEALPAPASPRAADAQTQRGGILFATHGCPTCHSGELMTNNATVDVGTGGAFQVPSLRGIAWRAPFLHDGCAQTLEDRFGSCATDKHGTTSDLSDSDIKDLVAYLETL
jgi:cytochrome c peroxidase